jgi:hypothetical protein
MLGSKFQSEYQARQDLASPLLQADQRLPLASVPARKTITKPRFAARTETDRPMIHLDFSICRPCLRTWLSSQTCPNLGLKEERSKRPTDQRQVVDKGGDEFRVVAFQIERSPEVDEWVVSRKPTVGRWLTQE